ncbi:uncharacterized protein FTJAE_2602 [Fusarium tjaetaba]|uniref:Uncharacterized protein n=1 Tax=Fusarium tjaetaba TaxID=1567544 RepID=A0A8H5S5I2_9HYPO|nr:uncharacterized protein FTJAE_2602 [Fusarium tjaetaba]KAF5644978.1 hypothetical protein FTJAE_2602 [Fusarium tjaetaba]
MARPYTRYPCGIYGPRNLARRNARRVKNERLVRARGEMTDVPPPLSPGQQQLFSFYSPSLEAGEYSVGVKQTLKSPSTIDEPFEIPETGAPQLFDVVAPRYSLPDGAVHSSFPPQGYGALAKTLPHVVLSDPHLAWARGASDSPALEDPEYTRSKVPWLAMLVFTQNELTLSAAQLSTVFSSTSLEGSAQQTQTLTVNIPVADVQNIHSTISPISGVTPDPLDDSNADIVMVPSALFTELFTSYHADGLQVPDQSGPDVARYKYLAHVRDINTLGMADAGVEDNGVFGIVVSHRTGPLSNTQPRPVVAHLVSIEGVESDYMKRQWPIANDTKFVALASLYSWNFITLPEGSFDMETTFVNLGTTPAGLNLLRVPETTLSSIDASTPVGARMKSRLEDGYTLTKYRTALGEETAALYRSPFTPTLVPYPVLPPKPKLRSCWLSDSGIDLQIMDPAVGIMDITYSVAWQLGKALAVADPHFTTALGRLRTDIYSGGLERARTAILRERGMYMTRSDIADDLSETLRRLNTLHKNTNGLHRQGGSMADRWQRPRQPMSSLSYYSPEVQDLFHEHALQVGMNLTLSCDGDGTQRYDELNSASSANWMIVIKWVLDKMYLYSVPAQYLTTDPSHLPSESLRFFHVDRNWTDALVDGALSLGNHLSGPDNVRVVIHKMIEDFLFPPPSDQEEVVAPPPQFPVYGFLLHSCAVTQYPDLKVSVELAGVTQQMSPIIRHENLDTVRGIMLCLLDHAPGNPGLASVTFTQPPHQQSFIAGAELDSQHIKTSYKRIYTASNLAPNPLPWKAVEWFREANNDATPPPPPPSPKFVFKWGLDPDPEVRTLLLVPWAADVNNILNYYGEDGGIYKDLYPNSAMAGIQLNNPIYRLTISTPQPDKGKGQSFERTVVASLPPVMKAQIAAKEVETTVSPSILPLPTKESSISRATTVTKRPPPSVRVGSGFELGMGHGYPRYTPPHYQRVVANLDRPFPISRSIHNSDSESPEGGSLGGGPVVPPTFKYMVRPVDNDPTKDGIPAGTSIPQDLVFRVAMTDPGTDGFHLEQLVILLQLAVKPGDEKYCLLAGPTYTGPGPFMTSNVRFFVQAQIQPPSDSDPYTYLALSVQARSTRGWAEQGMYNDLTFILPVCDIAPSSPSQTFPLKITPSYNGRTPVEQTDYYAIKIQNASN